MAKELDLDPALQYEIVSAAMRLVGGVSLPVHKRISKGGYTNKPGVWAEHLNALRLALNKIEPGGLADQQIGGKV